ncbi:MAG: glutathione S-transferase family protein [Rhodospirillales bacterium]|jgi:GST-like protein|nr:glutathione S-transferase family protein [Rhodospirillales bacterium]
MIDLYFWTTDNGYKARQMIEESGLDHNLKPVALPKKEQFAPEFLKISPGHKIPAIVDDDGPGGQRVTLFESGAILRYLADKSDKGLYPTDPIERLNVDQWLFFGSATFTTHAQQLGHFAVRMKEKVPQAIEHYTGQYLDMLGVFDTHLADNEYLAGGYSIADISAYPDVHQHEMLSISLDDFPNLKRWHDTITARPAIERAWGPF